jgi:hypothetical protein
MPETKLMMIEAKMADQNEVIVSALLICVVTSSIAALITIRNSPALMITAGSVINFKNDPKKVLMRERMRATQR